MAATRWPGAALGLIIIARLTSGDTPPGPGPFSDSVLQEQPVRGAERAIADDGWRTGKLCTIRARNGSNATAQLQKAIARCGDRAQGGTVLIPRGLVLYTASLWLRSNLTLRIEGALVGTASGYGEGPNVSDAPLT